VTATSFGQAARRLMLVHAHPDDETINNGATMAKYVAEGAEVCLVTCTLGEEGEVLVDELGHLAADQGDELGWHRLGELKEAMGILGVTDFVRLGGDGRFRDSGMAYDERRRAIPRDVLRHGIFWTVDLLEAANELVPLIRSRRPQVLITYNEVGNYGHPDHIQAHRVAMYGYLLAGISSYRPDLGQPWSVSRVLWTTMSLSGIRRAAQAPGQAGMAEWSKIFEPGGPLESAASLDEDIAVQIDGTRWVQQKLDAMLAHATQIRPDGRMFAAPEEPGSSRWAAECYRLAAGLPFSADEGPASDLFEGLS
jgi:N-acetyl-1-D-myo-inositol-2-amino-2-deoxy-alpha-D-glucopyranoside deacetylase